MHFNAFHSIKLIRFFPRKRGRESSRQKLKQKNNTDAVALTFILFSIFFYKLELLPLLSIFPRNKIFLHLFVKKSSLKLSRYHMPKAHTESRYGVSWLLNILRCKGLIQSQKKKKKKTEDYWQLSILSQLWIISHHLKDSLD